MSDPRPVRVRIAPCLELSILTVVLIGWLTVTALLALLIFA